MEANDPNPFSEVDIALSLEKAKPRYQFDASFFPETLSENAKSKFNESWAKKVEYALEKEKILGKIANLENILKIYTNDVSQLENEKKNIVETLEHFQKLDFELAHDFVRLLVLKQGQVK